MKKHILNLVFSILLLLHSSIARADPAALPFVHPLFCDNMVLQRDIAVPVWGWTTPGATVSVSILDQSSKTVADASGRWNAKIGPIRAGGPYTLTIDGPLKVQINNVLVGDVWLCSGQSNMYFPVKNAAEADKITASADLPMVRLCSVPAHPAAEAQCTLKDPVKWEPASPQAVKDFSAVAFCFGSRLNLDLKVPIGLIHTSAGATTGEAWSSIEALKSVPGGERDVADLEEWKGLLVEWAKYDADPAGFRKLMVDWYCKNDPGSASEQGWADPAMDDSDWKPINLPGTWQKGALPGFEGVVWFRREFDLPGNLKGKDAVLFLGPMDRRDTVWVNGSKIGQSDSNGWVRQYKVPAANLKETHNKVAVRVLGAGGFVGDASQLVLKASVEAGAQGAGATSLALDGAWKYRVGVKLKDASRVPSLWSGNPSIPGALFNGAISALMPFAIKGAVWYQGESNAFNSPKYAKSLPAMIKDWRSRFGVGDFPFLIVQLPGFGETHAEPGDFAWARFRDVQSTIAATAPNCGIVNTIDLGEPKNVHPHNKLEVGRRVALLAEAMVYGRPVDFSGPVFKSIRVDGDKIILQFDHAEGLATVDAQKPIGFAIAGEDKHFVWADAKIDGTAAIISSPQVPKPVAVRYAWDETPKCNLTNRAQLPASPFRSDNW